MEKRSLILPHDRLGKRTLVSPESIRDTYVRQALPIEPDRTSADLDQAFLTNGQVERMNRTIKEATVQRYHYDRHDQLEAHLAGFNNAYN